MRQAILLLVGVVIIGILITACDRRELNVPTDPYQVSSDDASRVLAFQYVTHIGAGDYYHITLQETSRHNRDINTDEVTISIGDSLITLYYVDFVPMFTGWLSEDAHLLSQEQQVNLKINDVSIVNTLVKKVNKANAAFPATYDYLLPLNLNWAVESGNQYQFAKAGAWSNNQEGDYHPQYVYSKRIAAYSRSHTFPSNCVDISGTPLDVIISFGVEEVNYKIVGNTAVMVYQDELTAYAAGKRQEATRQLDFQALELYQKVKELNKS